jgi:hypothetical protein
MSIQLEVGKTYVTRHGDKVQVVAQDETDSTWSYKSDSGGWYRANGTFNPNPTLLDSHDIVALWEDWEDKRAVDKATPSPHVLDAAAYLTNAASTMAERGKQYDSPQGERSMGKTVQAFNTITGQDLTEAQGWLFMSVLKKVRQYQAGAHLDSCVDDVAYTALFAEARMQEKQS